ncbi:MAG: molecular chaperone DnaJ [Acidimicrobiia bacterium]
MPADYYELLGVDHHATDDEIKKAYRRLARQYHPDTNPDPDAEARFKEISVAYETLRDPEKRRRYDMFGPEGGPTAAEGFGIGDLFDAFFGGDPFGGRRGPAGPAPGPDAETRLDLTLEEAAFGVTKTVSVRMPVPCDRCDGSGCEPGTHPSTCDVCGGSGEVRQVRRTILGQMVTASPCTACGATGRRILNRCGQCHGDGRVQAMPSVEVEVPAGIDDGQRLRLGGRGPAAARGGQPGDLYVSISVATHPTLRRQGNDLVHVRRVTMTQAALGAQLVVPTLEGDEELELPPGTQPGREFRLRGRGVPALRGRGRGDVIVRIDVEIPGHLSKEEAELLRSLAALRGEDVAANEAGFFKRVRSAFQ